MRVRPPLYLYCLCRARLALPRGLKGIGKKPLHLIPCREIAAVVSEAREKARATTLEDALLHGKIVEEVQELSPVIPMRAFSSMQREEVRKFLEGHYEELKAHLQRIEGKLEIGIRLIAPLPHRGERQPHQPGKGRQKTPSRCRDRASALSASPGEKYLLQRRKFYQEKDAVKGSYEESAERLSDYLRPLWEEKRLEYHPHASPPLLSLYFLVRKDKVEAFFKTFQGIDNKIRGFKPLLSGPWPPYNFVPPGLNGLK